MKFLADKSLFLLVALASLSAGKSFARNQSTSYATSPTTESPPSNVANPWAFGVERLVGPDALARDTGINMLHGMYTVIPNLQIGLGFGFANNFDLMALGPDVRYTFLTRGLASLFAMYNVDYVHGTSGQGADVNGCGMGALLGFDYALTNSLHLSFAYGLEFGFGSAYVHHISVTNNGFEGNFGIHWYL